MQSPVLRRGVSAGGASKHGHDKFSAHLYSGGNPFHQRRKKKKKKRLLFEDDRRPYVVS